MKLLHGTILCLASAFALAYDENVALSAATSPADRHQWHPRYLAAKEDQERKLEANQMVQKAMSQGAQRQLHGNPASIIKIDTYFHVILSGPEEDGDDVDEETIDIQLQILNEAYGGKENSFFTDCDGNPSVSYETGVRFVKAGPTTRTKDTDLLAGENIESITEEEFRDLFFITDSGPFVEDFFSYGNFTNQTAEEKYSELISKAPNGFQTGIPFALGKKLRQGDCNALNIYIVPGVYMSAFGFASQPYNCKVSGVYQDIDGVLIHRGTLPFSNFTHPNPNSFLGLFTPAEEALTYVNEGDTTVHEVGHWLGLEHTFAGATEDGRTGCDVYAGDEILDTPAQEGAAPYYLPYSELCASRPCCPTDLDTCPHVPGTDPVWNFMDYTDDCCLHRFSPQQAERMHYVWSLFREPTEAEEMEEDAMDEEEDLPLEVVTERSGEAAVDGKDTAPAGEESSAMVIFGQTLGAFMAVVCSWVLL